MIEHLYIKNVALIDEANIDFNEGLNILSGETGSGKSIIIDSINFVLGERASRDFIHKNCESAFVEAIISVNSEEVRNELAKLGAKTDEENNLLLGRSMNIKGKSICKLNGKPITVGMMKEISSLMVDIHGQHEHQSLLNPSRHIMLLDKFCSEELEELKKKLNDESREYRKIIKGIAEIEGTSGDKERQIEYLKFQLEEIEQMNLKKGEEEELNKRYNILSSAEKLKILSGGILADLKRTEETSAEERILGALKRLYEITELDESLKEVCEQLETVSSLLYDVINEVSDYNDSIEYNPTELTEIEERLDLIYAMKRKYGKDVEQLIEFAEELREKLEIIENSESDLIELKGRKEKREKTIRAICREITEERQKAAEKIEKEIVKALTELGMTNAQFKVKIEKKGTFNADGWDKAEFLISANLGEELKPLAKIASGGEMSRVMLSMKAVLAEADNIETFIFDEIDTGVSGRTAQQVAEKLAYIARRNQILCITHLPQIASMGDSNYLIEKSSDDENTRTSIKEIEGEEINRELARLIGGAEITETTLTAAEEMKKQAIRLKEEIKTEE